ncbi:sugar ABC transporter substrate-binding protein [Pseudodesulfovibrio cashew]|uniref:Sugar ABC transporter substrate-binding protein n=1 Tax=Pseudodesulfovibrio cashew TaxID=2678688 RepID=A0A6I6J8M8_9BACT|nr:polysaccharide biosynthesis/export family protein [Pseudodesulfovibrio cashew]QGY39186.1 sugar ABC transporter substrate-binding protein [Pseudodesulfovibrio cashew]
MKRVILVVVLAALLVPAVCRADDYVIGEGDVLSVHVWGEPELNSQVIVRPDGKISMPGVDDVTASGLTIPELKKLMVKQISLLVKEPIVNVSLIRSVNSRVYVVGGGVDPRVFEMSQRTTLLHVLASLGSLATADLTKAYVYRDGKKIMSDFSGVFSKGEFGKDIQLEPGDTIYLPVKYDQNVYIIGAVAQPKAILFREGLTVLDALLFAGEFNKYADEDELVIVRTNDGKKERITVKTEDLMKKGELQQNILLQAGDYVIAKETFF